MNLALQSYRFKNRLLSMLFPQLAAKQAVWTFLTPRRLIQKQWELEAESSGIRFNINPEISVIKWLPVTENKSNKPILLVHGWESRATQMFGFVPGLLNKGYQVFAVDMPAHGYSEGSISDANKFVQTILLAQQELGGFDAIIAHSLGAGATSHAISQGLKSNKLVLISGPSSVETIMRQFSTFIGLNHKASNLFVHFTGEQVGIKASEMDAKTLLHKNDIPTLFIHDENDTIVPISESQRLMLVFTNSELFITTDLGHRKILKSKRVMEKIDQFLHCAGNRKVSEAVTT